MPRIDGIHSPNWGGKRTGAGYPAGVPKNTPGMRCDAILRELIESGEIRHPIEGLLRIAADERRDVDVRMRAAGIALPYCAPKLQSIEVKGVIEKTQTFVVNLTGVSPPEPPKVTTGKNGEAVIDMDPDEVPVDVEALLQ